MTENVDEVAKQLGMTMRENKVPLTGNETLVEPAEPKGKGGITVGNMSRAAQAAKSDQKPAQISNTNN